MPAQTTALIALLTTLPYQVWLVYASEKLHAGSRAENAGQAVR